MTSGLLIGSGSYRLGGWFGLPFLIPALLPALGADGLLFTGWEGAVLHALGIGHPPTPVTVAIVAALIAVGLAANLLLVRSVAIGRNAAGRYQMGGPERERPKTDKERRLCRSLKSRTCISATAIMSRCTTCPSLWSAAMSKQFLGFLITLIFLAASLFTIGLLVAAIAPNGRAANGIGGLLVWPMMFSAGMWTPGFTPEIIRRIGEFTPLGAGVQALQRTWVGGWPQPQHLIVMVGCVLIFGVLATKAFRWE
jgi:hypothetical protein